VNDRTRDLAKTREEALEASRAKSEFLANMSHEIRTPLAAISGYSFLLAKTLLAPSQQDYVARIDTATRSLLSILQDILDFSRIESGNMELYEVDFSLRDLCHKVIATIESEALKKSIDIVLELDESLPDRYKGDSLRLSQILVNLGSNAVKFTQRGKVMLNIAIDSRQDDVIRLRFSVRDTGIGLLPDQVDRLFQPFTQADASITRQYGGTGLGLAICQRLVSLMQGDIGLQSVAGVGSTFFFTIPLKPLRHDHLPARTGSGDGTDHSATASEPTRALQGYRLLLVEDHEINQMLLRELLEMEGATVDVASNGLEALARIRHPGKVFDAVLMDVQMPQMDGMEATRQIRKHPGGAGLPIIAMTAHTRDEDREACLAAGMNDYCGKPIDIPGLIRILRHWVGQQAVPQTLPLPATVAASDPAHPTTTVDFTLLKPVINVDEGLLRCHNDAARYGQLLKLFASGYRDFAAEARALHESGQKDRLNKAIHTLKGTAGNLGAESLLASVRLVLAELEHPASLTAPVGLEALLADTDVLLQALQQWEAQLPPEPADDAGMAEDGADFSADTLFERFTRALAQNDLAAVPLWHRFRAGKPSHGNSDPLLNDIDRAVQRLDFPDALRKVNRWKHDNR
jgi:CheY-like chemotaxis protein/nitrogen-specific signal transduction histidine kinase